MLWAGLVVVVVLGGLTLWFHSETFIKWKPTIVYWLMGGGLLIGEVFMKRDDAVANDGRTDRSTGSGLAPSDLGLGGVFVSMGLLNLYVAFNYSTDTWVTFKMWGTMGLLLVFALIQVCT